MTSEFYKTLVEHRILMNHPETIHPEYNIINHSKIDFINYAMENNYIEDEYVFWTDFGYYHSILHDDPTLFPTKILDITKINKKKINCMIRDIILPEDNNIIEVVLSGKVSITGTFYGGSVSIMKEFQNLYHSCVEELHYHNIVDDDQHVLLRCYFKNPEFFELYHDGVKFNNLVLSEMFCLFNDKEVANHVIGLKVFNDPSFVDLIKDSQIYKIYNNSEKMKIFQHPDVITILQNSKEENFYLGNNYIIQREWPRALNCFQVTE
jgi:hypothetical protein